MLLEPIEPTSSHSGFDIAGYKQHSPAPNVRVNYWEIDPANRLGDTKAGY